MGRGGIKILEIKVKKIKGIDGFKKFR